MKPRRGGAALLSLALSASVSIRAAADETLPPPFPIAPAPTLDLGGPTKSARAGDALDPRRFELAGFPIVGGNSDIGFQFGGAATWTRFYDGVQPYLWNVDLLLSGSVKSDQNGWNVVQQSHVLRLDAPDVFDHHGRLDSRASFQRTIDEGYYGLGNASLAGPRPGEAQSARLNEYVQEEARVRVITRIHTKSVFELALAANLRYEAPSLYAGSKLAADALATAANGSSPLVRGTRDEGLAGVSAGFIVDTRDSEFITRRGYFYQVGGAATVATAEGIAYGQLGAVLSHYAPLGGAFIFASRFIADMQLGRVPFYDLQQGGVFEPQYLFGGEQGIRGVPQGRYAGALKIVSNLEIRSVLPRFVLLEQRLRLGTTTFFDAGRVWKGYAFDPASDGTKLGLKYGIGAGAFLQWGEAAIFRIEAAYSPDAQAANPGFPIGIYVSDGTMF